MVDISIVKHRERATIIGETDKGKQWLRANFTDTIDGVALRRMNDSVEDLVIAFRQAGLKVDIK